MLALARHSPAVEAPPPVYRPEGIIDPLSANDNPWILETRLRAYGIDVPDQIKIKAQMELARLGVAPYRKIGRIEYYVLRLVATRNFKRFTVDEHNKHGELWGGYMPPETTVAMRQVIRCLPDAKITIYALEDDPYWSVTHHGQEVFCGGWFRQSADFATEVIKF